MSYPIDFYRHVLAIREWEGMSFLAIATRFQVGVASLQRWFRRLELCSYKRKIDLEQLAEDVCQCPDDQYEYAARFGMTQKGI